MTWLSNCGYKLFIEDLSWLKNKFYLLEDVHSDFNRKHQSRTLCLNTLTLDLPGMYWFICTWRIFLEYIIIYRNHKLPTDSWLMVFSLQKSYSSIQTILLQTINYCYLQDLKNNNPVLRHNHHLNYHGSMSLWSIDENSKTLFCL